ncbi:MAG TPA: response regulator, partial [Thermogutta sp.]|nr:response regulator [Thermogutta sp.]
MSKRVLIADDSVLIRRMIAEVLTQAGYEVVGEATNGAEAVAKYRELNPDVVTLDIVMPGTDGLYALDGILALNPNAKVV